MSIIIIGASLLRNQSNLHSTRTSAWAKAVCGQKRSFIIRMKIQLQKLFHPTVSVLGKFLLILASLSSWKYADAEKPTTFSSIPIYILSIFVLARFPKSQREHWLNRSLKLKMAFISFENDKKITWFSGVFSDVFCFASTVSYWFWWFAKQHLWQCK